MSKVLPEYADVDRRIAATSDFIKENILLSSSKLDEQMNIALFYLMFWIIIWIVKRKREVLR